MYRLLAVNEFQALYEHRADKPDQPIEPFAYLNDLLSIRSAAGFVTFLKNHPQGLKDLERSSIIEHEIKMARYRFFWDSRFEYSEKVMMNAATACGVDYLDAATDISGHYDEVGAAQALGDRLHAFVEKYGRDAVMTQEMRDEYNSILDNAPKADLYRLEFDSLGHLVDRIEALLLLSASVRVETEIGKKFEYRKENCFPGLGHDDEQNIVAVPFEVILEVLPTGMMPGKMDYKLREAKYLALHSVPQDWEEIDYSDDPRRFDEMGLEVKLITIIEEPDIAIKVAINDIVAFALTEWVAHFSSMQGVSNSYTEGLTIRQSKMNDVILELANIVVERRVGICPVCNRPFVVKRKPGTNGKLNKKYCTDSCKVRDSAGSKRKGGSANNSA